MSNKTEMHRLLELRTNWKLTQIAMCHIFKYQLYRYRKLEACQSLEELKQTITVKEAEDLADFYKIKVNELLSPLKN